MFRRIGLVMLCVVILCQTLAFAGENGKQKPVKKGILLVTFGTSVPEAQIAFERIEKKVKAAFPDVPMRWAYTSHIIRHKLAKQGKILDSVEMALAKMMDEGFTHVAVQSLHVIAGEEFNDLHQNVQAFRTMSGGIAQLVVGYPLLGNQEDLKRVNEAMINHIPKERKPDEAVIFMGHGTPHPVNAVYAGMMYYFQNKDTNIFVATVDGGPAIEEIREILVKKGIKKAYLIPLMSVAGDHVRNDMSGDGKDSWKNILAAAEIQSVPILKGMAEYDDIIDIWTDHLKTAMSGF